MKYIFNKILSALLVIVLIVGIISVAPTAYAETNSALTYLIGPFSLQTKTTPNDRFYAIINGTEREYSDDIDITSIQNKAINSESVVYELKNSVITNVFTINEVLSPNIKVKYTADNGLHYKNGKFSQSQFDLNVIVSVGINQSKVDSEFLWFFNEKEKNLLTLNLKGLKITTPYGADFGSSGFAFWKSYTDEVNESYDDKIKVNENKTYSFTVNLRNDKALNQSEYTMDFSVTPTFDFGSVAQTTASVKVVNLDAQAAAIEAKKEAQKESSPSGKAVASAEKTLELSGSLVTASSTFNNFFTSEQKRRLDEFAYVWVNDLILAEIIDYSEFNLKQEAEELVQKKVFSKLGIDSRMLTQGDSLEGSVNLLATTKDGTEVLINYVADLSNFKFWFGTKPYAVTGQLKLSVFKLSDGSQMGMTETVMVNYADVDTFVKNLQDIAKSTIFNIGKDVYGLSASKTADKAASAITDGLMTKALNSKSNYFSVVSRLTQKQKSVIQKALARVLTDQLKDCNQTVFKLLTTPSSAAKIHSFECPVNIKVYDNDGNLCASIVNNQVDELFSEVFATVNGDRKEFYLTGDDYYFVITGYDNGTMDYTVREFDNNGEIRKLTYNDVPISNGCIYYSLSPETENMSNSYFDLVDKDGNVISPDNGEDLLFIDVENLINSGMCGNDAYWKLYKDGELYINGNGSINSHPWYEYRSRIKTIRIVKGITIIDDYAFRDCKSLTSVTISESVTSIGEWVFLDCGCLSSVTIPNGVKSIGKWAFRDCKSLISVTIPKSVTDIGDGAFGGCLSLEKIDVDANNSCYDSRSNCNAIINTSSNTLICGCRNTNIPDSITSIGKFAFYCCSSLASVDIPDGVISIGDSAFDDCSSLVSATIPNSVTSIGDYAFAGCDISSITIPESVTHIGSYAFWCCPKLTSIIIPNGVTSISGHVFERCGSLTSVTIPNSVTNIGANAFSNCRSLSSITIPDSATDIGIAAFSYCTSLTDLVIPDRVMSIGYSAFTGCTSLSKITVSDSVTSIDRFAFDDTEWYNKQPAGLVYVGKVAYKFKGEMPENTSIIIKDGTKGIAGSAFEGCVGLTRITIPDSVKCLGAFAFCGCSEITSITIPDTVTYIGNFAFSGCSNLTSVTIPQSVENVNYCAFGYERNNKKIEKFTIYGYKNTAAEKYANENRFKFIILEDITHPIVIGDSDGDSVVTAKDRINLSRYLAKWSGYESINVSAADVNNDSKVNAKDRIILARHLAKWQGYETLPFVKNE